MNSWPSSALREVGSGNNLIQILTLGARKAVGVYVGEMQRNLERLLRDAKASISSGQIPYPRRADIESSKYVEEVECVYRELGGKKRAFPLRLRKWDLEVNGVAVELDEYLHFNRYRAVTLTSGAYQDLTCFPLALYKTYCKTYEERCLRAGSYGRKWTSPSCESQFGRGPKPRDLSGRGAPRWRQRAFYDFVKDLTPLVLRKPLVRVAVWDTVEVGHRPRTLEEILTEPSLAAAEGILSLIERRRPR